MSFFQIILRMALVGFIGMFIIISLAGCNTNRCAQRFSPEDARYQCLNCWVVAYMEDNTTYWYTTDQRYHAFREWRRRTGHRLDEVLLLGEQGGAVLDARDLAEAAGTIPYEVLTNVSRRVPRVYLNG